MRAALEKHPSPLFQLRNRVLRLMRAGAGGLAPSITPDDIVGWRIAKIGDRWVVMEPIRASARLALGAFAKDVARAPRCGAIGAAIHCGCLRERAALAGDHPQPLVRPRAAVQRSHRALHPRGHHRNLRPEESAGKARERPQGNGRRAPTMMAATAGMAIGQNSAVTAKRRAS